MPGDAFQRVFIDTFFVIALINPRDAYHGRALKLSDQFEGRAVVTTDAVLLEIGNGLARQFKAQAVAVIGHLMSSREAEIVRLEPKLFEQAFALYQLHQDKEWGLVDCVSFTVMRELGLEAALTFDQHFVQAGFRALMRA